MKHIAWSNTQDISSRSYRCGHCGNLVASQKGVAGYHRYGPHEHEEEDAWIYICSHCTRPTFFDLDGKQLPGVIFGSPIENLPDKSVDDLYEEARRSFSDGNYTAAVLCSRKILMHIAVAKKAQPGQSFAAYVDYLVDNHFIPPDARDWVHHIRLRGNEANHEIVIMSKDDAEELLVFIEMLLKVIFDFPTRVGRKPGP